MKKSECFMDNGPHFINFGRMETGEKYSICIARRDVDEDGIHCCGCGKTIEYGPQQGPMYEYEDAILQWSTCSPKCSKKVTSRIWGLPWWAKDAYLDAMITEWNAKNDLRIAFENGKGAQ